MPFDYDLIIIGGTSAARYAAATASVWKARVALVEPNADLMLGTEDLRHQAFIRVGRVVQQMQRLSQFGLSYKDDSETVSVDWAEMSAWVQSASAFGEEARSPAVLASLGVDVIVGDGEFCRRPKLAFVVNGRQLRSRRYLLAPGSHSALPAIDGVSKTACLIPELLWRSEVSSPPTTLIVIGSDPSGVEIAQTFARLGSYVTLVVNHPQILPHEDAEAARLIQAQLEIEGVRVLTQTEVTQVREIDGKKWVQAGSQALEADAVLLACGQQPQVTSLNLEAAGVAVSARGIRVNAKLQTTNPLIYACGSAIGGYPFAHIAHYEAKVALKNALFFSTSQVDYRAIPWAVFTNPGLARVGLTETQARRYYKDDILIARQYLKTVSKAQLQGETTGFCKLIARSNGEILGAHIVSSDAEEMIGAIALAMHHKNSLNTLASLPSINPSLSEIVYQTAAQWQQQRRDRSTFLNDLLETWFMWRRG